MNTADNDQELIDTALLAAQLAGGTLVNQFNSSHRSELKNDLSIVTEVDLASERQIKELIASRHPGHSFIGEETGQTASHSPFTWVVDPLDGTKNFVRGVPLFSVEIAVLKDGLPYIGVSNLPLMDDFLWAARGKGTHSKNGQVHASSINQLSAAYVSFGNIKHFHRTGKLDRFVQLLDNASQCRGIGDAWSFHLLARGCIDIFADAWTAFWDVAALTVIVEEAGGKVTDFQGRPISPMTNTVLATNSKLHQAALTYFEN